MENDMDTGAMQGFILGISLKPELEAKVLEVLNLRALSATQATWRFPQ